MLGVCVCVCVYIIKVQSWVILYQIITAHILTHAPLWVIDCKEISLPMMF
jgi:hypothetical protein